MFIREIREQKGITQEELAAIVDLSPVTLGRYDRGEREPRTKDLIKIAEALDVTVDELLNGISQQSEAPAPNLGEPVTMLGDATPLPLLNLNACAGDGLCALDDDNEVNDLVFLPDLCSLEAHTHFCVKVNGDSMQPLLEDGDYAVVLKAEYCSCNLRFGQVVLINYCGDNFIRGVHKTSPLIFAPQDKSYPDIVISDEPYTLIGEVVGKVSYKKIFSAFK